MTYSKSTLALLFVTLVVLLAGYDGSSDSFRYKLTLSIDTPTGPKTGFSVVEVNTSQAPTFWGRGGSGRARGEAVYVDLGPGRRPLIAVMTLHHPKPKAWCGSRACRTVHRC